MRTTTGEGVSWGRRPPVPRQCWAASAGEGPEPISDGEDEVVRNVGPSICRLVFNDTRPHLDYHHHQQLSTTCLRRLAAALLPVSMTTTTDPTASRVDATPEMAVVDPPGADGSQNHSAWGGSVDIAVDNDCCRPSSVASSRCASSNRSVHNCRKVRRYAFEFDDSASCSRNRSVVSSFVLCLN